MKNRMRELRSFGSVRGEGSDVLAYSENRADSGRSIKMENRLTVFYRPAKNGADRAEQGERKPLNSLAPANAQSRSVGLASVS